MDRSHRTRLWQAVCLAIGLLAISACALTPTAIIPTSAPPVQPTPSTAMVPSPLPSTISPTSPPNKPPLPAGKNTPTSLALSPDGTTLAVGTSQGIYAYNVTSQKQLWFKASANNPASLTFSQDGSSLFVGAAYPFGSVIQSLTVLASISGDVLFQVKTSADPQGSWSPDGKKLLTSGDCQEIEVRDALTGKLLHTIQGATCNAADPSYMQAFWSWDGTRIYALLGSKMMGWDASTYKPLAGYAPDLPPFSTGLSYMVLPSPTEDLIALENGITVAILDEKTGKTIKSFPGAQPDLPVGNLAWSPDGKRLAADFSYGQLVWDVHTGQQTANLKDYPTPFFSDSTVGRTLAWLPDNHTLVGLFSANDIMNAVDLDTGKIVFSLPQPVNP